MKKTLLSICFLFSIAAMAQTGKFSISVGPSVSNALDRAGEDYYKNGFGGSVKAFYNVSKNGALMANVNYMRFGSNNKPFIPSHSLYSFKLGYRNYIGNTNLFVQGDAGLVNISIKEYNKNVFGASAGFGYSLKLGKQSYLDIAPSFNYLRTQAVRNNYVDLNLSYRFSLGKKK